MSRDAPGSAAGVRICTTALVEAGVEVGYGTSIWDHVHVRAPARIGEHCIIGEKTYIAYGVAIGNRVKINALVYVCTAVTIEDGVMISAGTVFTNDLLPRATTPDLRQLRSSAPDEATRPTRVCAGATVGANCTIGSGLTIGRFAMIGMGSVVTRSVGDFQLVVGNPARLVGWVCRCGEILGRAAASAPTPAETACAGCGLRYAIGVSEVRELAPPGPP